MIATSIRTKPYNVLHILTTDKYQELFINCDKSIEEIIKS